MDGISPVGPTTNRFASSRKFFPPSPSVDPSLVRRGQGPNGPFAIRSTLKGHNGTVRSVKFSPHPAILASGGAGDCKMRVWDVNQGRIASVSISVTHLTLRCPIEGVHRTRRSYPHCGVGE
jgi:WD40 repeat protein